MLILNIFYMHYNTVGGPTKNRPNWFNYEVCLRNLLRTIDAAPDDVYVKLNLIFDGGISDFKNDFSSKYFDAESTICEKNKCLKVHFIEAGSGEKSGQLTLEYIFKSDYGDNELIYTLENDYLHADAWIENVRDVFKSRIKYDYISLYDHRDKYKYIDGFLPRYNLLKSQIYASKKIHWRVTPSTCFSFVAKPQTLKSDLWFFLHFRDQFVQPLLRIFKRRILISALPGQSTHCMARFLSPTVDWEAVSIKDMPL